MGGQKIHPVLSLVMQNFRNVITSLYRSKRQVVGKTVDSGAFGHCHSIPAAQCARQTKLLGKLAKQTCLPIRKKAPYSLSLIKVYLLTATEIKTGRIFIKILIIFRLSSGVAK